LRSMRKRIADSGAAQSFKTGPGGVYDLDFLLGRLEAGAALLATGEQLPQRLEALLERELLTPEQAADLLHAADLFRRVDHAIRVVEGRTRMWLPESDRLRGSVEKILECSDLDGALRTEMGRVRSVFDSVFRD